MAKGLIGRKVGMANIFDAEGKMITVTVLEIGPCFVSQLKTVDKEGYDSVQLAFGEIKEKNLSKAERGHLSKSGVSPLAHLVEFRNFGETTLGSQIKATDLFAVGDKVKVSGRSKGKGTQGVVKRHGFSGGPKAHGSRFQRHPGSIGSNTTPARVFKGMRMGGRTGFVNVTVRNLKVVKIQEADNLVFVSGSVPGRDNGIVTIEKLG